MKSKPKPKNETIIREKPAYFDLFQKKPTRFRIYETLFYGIVLLLLSQVIPPNSGQYQIAAIVSGAIIIGVAPHLYRRFLSPEYILLRNELVINMKGQERQYPLSEVERASKYKPVFKLNGKKESLMVSKDFIDKLDSQLEKVQRTKKR